MSALINQIPPVVWQKTICSQFNIQDLGRFSCVCRTWNLIAVDDTWKIIFEKTFPKAQKLSSRTWKNSCKFIVFEKPFKEYECKETFFEWERKNVVALHDQLLLVYSYQAFQVWNWQKKELLSTLQLTNSNDRNFSGSVSLKGDIVAFNIKFKMTAWNWKTKNSTAWFAHNDIIHSVYIDGEHIATGSKDKTIKIWRCSFSDKSKEPDLLAVFNIQEKLPLNDAITCLALHNDIVAIALTGKSLDKPKCQNLARWNWRADALCELTPPSNQWDIKKMILDGDVLALCASDCVAVLDWHNDKILLTLINNHMLDIALQGNMLICNRGIHILRNIGLGTVTILEDHRIEVWNWRINECHKTFKRDSNPQFEFITIMGHQIFSITSKEVKTWSFAKSKYAVINNIVKGWNKINEWLSTPI